MIKDTTTVRCIADFNNDVQKRITGLESDDTFNFIKGNFYKAIYDSKFKRDIKLYDHNNNYLDFGMMSGFNENIIPKYFRLLTVVDKRKEKLKKIQECSK